MLRFDVRLLVEADFYKGSLSSEGTKLGVNRARWDFVANPSLHCKKPQCRPIALITTCCAYRGLRSAAGPRLRFPDLGWSLLFFAGEVLALVPNPVPRPLPREQ